MKLQVELLVAGDDWGAWASLWRRLLDKHSGEALNTLENDYPDPATALRLLDEGNGDPIKCCEPKRKGASDEKSGDFHKG